MNGPSLENISEIAYTWKSVITLTQGNWYEERAALLNRTSITANQQEHTNLNVSSKHMDFDETL